jgi:hypothetical protein
MQDLVNVSHTSMMVIADVNLASEKATISNLNSLDTGNMCQVTHRDPIADDQRRMVSFSAIRRYRLDPAEVADPYVFTKGNTGTAAYFCVMSHGGESDSCSPIHRDSSQCLAQ